MGKKVRESIDHVSSYAINKGMMMMFGFLISQQRIETIVGRLGA
jgi:hypothetical protein